MEDASRDGGRGGVRGGAPPPPAQGGRRRACAGTRCGEEGRHGTHAAAAGKKRKGRAMRHERRLPTGGRP
jgi:hypothetical protein